MDWRVLAGSLFRTHYYIKFPKQMKPVSASRTKATTTTREDDILLPSVLKLKPVIAPSKPVITTRKPVMVIRKPILIDSKEVFISVTDPLDV